ncbi:hypothetical protein [Embleya sp. NPDC005971]|uniref:hypothetical protein n=1 Tax=unclassified Embleya TaxID=2699296 RepID=UPI0033C2B22B
MYGNGDRDTPAWEQPGRFAHAAAGNEAGSKPRGRDGIAPTGWPRGVRPPGVAGWEETAVAWLFDLCPPGYRSHDLLRKYPLILARMARQHVAAALAAARHGYGTARVELAERVPAQAVEAALRMYEYEGSRAAATERAVRLVEEALAGERWEPRL